MLTYYIIIRVKLYCVNVLVWCPDVVSCSLNRFRLFAVLCNSVVNKQLKKSFLFSYLILKFNLSQDDSILIEWGGTETVIKDKVLYRLFYVHVHILSEFFRFSIEQIGTLSISIRYIIRNVVKYFAWQLY